jgi:hypothetical protein
MSQQEKTFAEAWAKSGDPQLAAKVAEYATPRTAIPRLVERPCVLAEVRRIQTERLYGDLLPAAIGLLHKVLLDDAENTRNRITAAKIVMDRTLGAADAAADAKEPHEMTADELAGRIARLRQRQLELAGQAVDVTPAEEQIEGPEPNAFG